MKQTRIKVMGYCFMMMTALLCSCSSDDDNTQQDDSNGRCMRQLTISNVMMNTRAAIDPKAYTATWEITDRPTYINLSRLSAELRYGTLTPSTAGTSTTLTGSVYCGMRDNIAIILPNVTPVLPSGENYPVDLRGQKGTLADIGARYHYIYGEGKVESVDGGTATGSITNTKSLLSLCKFTFTNGVSPVNVKSVQIGWGTNGAGGYPNSGTVSLADPANVHVTAGAPIADTPLVVTLDNANTDGVVYVALFPCETKLSFHFTVSDGTNTYTATKNAKMLEGKYYEVPVAVN